MKKLLLINPRTVNTGLSSAKFHQFPPLNLRILKELTDPEKFNVTIVDEFQESIEPSFDSADLVGITAMTPAAPRAYEISDEFRKRKIPTILGGIHATVLPDEAQQHADVIVTGEAEEIWGRVLSDFEANKLQTRYDGGRLEDMSRVPRVSAVKGYRLGFTTQTARGCPVGCDFCSVTSVNGAKVRARSIDDVVNELKAARDKGEKYVGFVDDNIVPPGPRHVQRSIKLFEKMAAEDLGMKWASQTSINFGNNGDVLYWAQKSGCVGVFIGFESLEKPTLEAMGKRLNVKQMDNQSSFIEPVKRIHDHGIAVLGGFIFGNDTDDEGVFDRTREFILRSQLDTAQYSILTPFPGTRLFEKYQKADRLLYTNFPEDWKKYDVSRIVTKPANGRKAEWIAEKVEQLYEDTNSLFPSLKRFPGTLWTIRNLTLSMGLLGINLGYRRQYRYNMKDK